MFLKRSFLFFALCLSFLPLVARAAALTITKANDSYEVVAGGSSGNTQASAIIISPSLSGSAANSVTLKSSLDGKVSNFTISEGASLTFSPSDITKGTTKSVTIKIAGTLTPGQVSKLTMSGSGIITKVVPISVVGTSGGGGTTGGVTGGTAVTGGASADSGAAGFSKSLVQNLADSTGFVFISWRVVRGAINTLLIIALLAISFSNILRINIDTYTVKKALPNLVIGVILANASFLIVKYMADIATVATYFFVHLSVGKIAPNGFSSFNEFFAATLKQLGVSTISSTFFGAGPLLAIVFVIIAIILILWLAFLLYFRLVAIYLLTILAPLAFVAYGIPGFEKYFKQWWQQFVKWLFILVAMSAVFWLMLVIASASTNNNSIASLLIMYLLFTTALTLPSKMGGAVIDRASKAFKNGAKFGYGATQAGGANMGLKGLGLEAKGKALQKQAEAARAAGRTAEATRLASKAAVLQRAGKGLQGAGKVIVTPTGIQEGYKAKLAAQKKGREVFVEGSPAYAKYAGADVMYGNKRKKAKEEFDGLSKEILSEKLNKSDYASVREKLAGLDEDTRNTILYGTPFRSGATAQNFGFGGKDLDNLGEYIEAYRAFDMDRRRARSTKRKSWSEDNASNYDPTVVNQNQGGQGGAGGANPYGDINNPDVQDKISSLKVHYDHFATSLGPQGSRDIARLGAEISEELDNAIENGEEGGMTGALDKARDFFEKAGYTRLVPLDGNTTYEQAGDMQEKVRRVTQAASAVGSNLPIENAAAISTLHEQTAQTLATQTASVADPIGKTQAVANSPEVGQTINNYIGQRAQLSGAQLSPQQIQQISQTVRQGITLDMTNKKTLNKIFGSEKFQQALGDTINDTSLNNPVAPVANPSASSQPPIPPTSTPIPPPTSSAPPTSPQPPAQS